MGYESKANNTRSVAIGTGITTNAVDQIVLGKYNVNDSTASFIIGNGTNSTNCSNALTISSADGTVNIKKLTINNNFVANNANITDLTIESQFNVQGMADIDSLTVYNGLTAGATTITDNLCMSNKRITDVNSINFGVGNLTINSGNINFGETPGSLNNISSIQFANNGSIGPDDSATVSISSNQVIINKGRLNLQGTSSEGNNSITANANLMIGNGNKVTKQNNIVCGLKNEHQGMMGLTIGYNNKNLQSNRGYVIGMGIQLLDDESPDGSPRFVFGKYNASIKANDLFVLANGSGATAANRSNAFVVDYSGNTTIAGTVQTKGLIVTNDSYGTDFPTNPVDGQIYFIIRG